MWLLVYKRQFYQIVESNRIESNFIPPNQNALVYDVYVYEKVLQWFWPADRSVELNRQGLGCRQLRLATDDSNQRRHLN